MKMKGAVSLKHRGGQGRVGFELVCLLVERSFLVHIDNVLFCLTDCQVYTLLLLSQWAKTK